MLKLENARLRRGESLPFPPRSERLVYENETWYFATRERGLKGPYPSLRDAERQLRSFVQRRD